MRLAMYSAAVLTAVGGGAGVQADSILIVNPGFEIDFAAPNTFPVGTPTGWDAYDPNNLLPAGGNALGVLNPADSTFFPSGAPEGSNVALVFLSSSIGSGPVGLSQTLGAVLQANTQYSLSVEVGDIASGTGAPPFDQFYELSGFPGYQVQLLAGGMVLAEDDNTLANVLTDGAFATSTVVFETGAAHAMLGEALEIRLINLNTADTPQFPGIEVDFDDVRLDAVAVVPSPASSALIGLGTLLIAGRRRRAV